MCMYICMTTSLCTPANVHDNMVYIYIYIPVIYLRLLLQKEGVVVSLTSMSCHMIIATVLLHAGQCANTRYSNQVGQRLVNQQYSLTTQSLSVFYENYHMYYDMYVYSLSICTVHTTSNSICIISDTNNPSLMTRITHFPRERRRFIDPKHMMLPKGGTVILNIDNLGNIQDMHMWYGNMYCSI